jgi:hypothetical protein
MKEAYAVTGYVPDNIAVKLGQAAARIREIDVRPERGMDEVVMRVTGADVAEVRTGASTGGETMVQLVLVPDAKVQTVVTVNGSDKGITRFYDPVLGRLTASATAKKIMI